MDGYDCDIESETCHRAEKMKECWISMVALNDIFIFFWNYENKNAVTYDTFRAKPWTMMIWTNSGLRLRMNRDMKLWTHFQDTSTACRTVMSPLRLGRLYILVSAFVSNNCVRILPRTQHLRHHLPGDSKSRSGIKASVRPISSSSAPSNWDMGGWTGPGSRATHIMRDEKIINVRVYVTNRWIAKVKGWCIVRKWKSTRTYSQDGWGANNRITVPIDGSVEGHILNYPITNVPHSGR
jgi:hypothetical protein